MTSLSWLQKKGQAKPPTLSQLQHLARVCGLAKHGTKRAVAERVAGAMRASRPPSASDRILSIDMGVRNFAFCLLTHQVAEVSRLSSPPPSSSDSTAAAATTPPQLAIHAWKVLDLTAADPAAVGDKGALSAIAVDLVNRHLLPLRPTHILIEQQRYRSGGGAAVQEWTLRVNALEAMLHAIMCTMRSLDMWHGHVEAVDPGRAAPFFFEDTGRLPSKMLKKMKIDLLGGWIASTDAGPLQLARGSQAVEDTAASFLAKWKPRGKASGSGTKAKASDAENGLHFKKLDDLTDCVIQGAAWARWQQTRYALSQGSTVEVLRGLL